MAQLNYNPNYYNHQGMWLDQWGNVCDPHCSGSNMSLNMNPGYPMNPMWMGTWHGPPPSAMGMCYPPPPCQMHHDVQSRSGSPPHSIKSRKSYLSKASRRKYRDEDDSDDECDDRRSIRSDRKSTGSRHPERLRSNRDTCSIPRDMKRRAIVVDHNERISIPRGRRSVEDSSSSENEYPMETEPSNAMVEEDTDDMEVKVDDYLEKNTELADIPNEKWECEHCTFVNDAGTRVCLICCKTPTSTSIKIVPSSPKGDRKNLAPKGRESKSLQRSRSSDDYSKDTSETESVLNKFEKQISLVDNATLKANNKNTEAAEYKKGRTSRKISFWPGTKFTSVQNKKFN